MPLDPDLSPPWVDILKQWPVWVRQLPPRTFIQLFDVQQNKALLAAGLSLLGNTDDHLFSAQEILAKAHPNQQRLLRIQTEQVYQVFAEHPEWIKDKGIVYCNLRTFSDVRGQFWRVHQASVPVQYDAAGRLARYRSHYRLLGPYHGEPLETSIHAAPQFPKEEELLRARLNRIKNEVLHELGFSPREEQLIRLMAAEEAHPEGSPKRDIPTIMGGISRRTVHKHCRSVLDKGRQAFPVNRFCTARDVVEYLVRQGLV